jgi:CDGSH-type Zn-finger protein
MTPVFTLGYAKGVLDPDVISGAIEIGTRPSHSDHRRSEVEGRGHVCRCGGSN